MYHHFIRKNIDDLLKMYPDKKDSDYFLWIITDIFNPFRFDKKIDEVTTEIYINEKHIENDKGKIRTPYPNKNIFQYSMKKGRNVCYGFPLKFNSIEELMAVHSIEIHWRFIISNCLITASIKYDIDINNNIDNHILDIHHQIDLDIKDYDIWVNLVKEFDDVYAFIPSEWKIDNSTDGLFFLKCTNEEMYNFDLEDAENFSSITDFFVLNQINVDYKLGYPEEVNYLYHLCLYKNLTNVDTVEGAEQL